MILKCPEYREHEDHHQLLSWWLARNVRHATVVHLDGHHDLGDPSDGEGVHCGNFLRAAIERGCVVRVVWVTPFSRDALAGSSDIGVLASLPGTLRDSACAPSRGRWELPLGHGKVAIRGYDDLPPPREVAHSELSVDLDFFYHPAVDGPTLDPVDWMGGFVRWMRRVEPSAVFVSLSARDGFVPPTYRPAILWLRASLAGASQPEWAADLWRRVVAAELCRVEQTVVPGERPPSDSELAAEALFWRAWRAYRRGDWAAAAAMQANLDPALRFHPAEELMVAYQARRLPSYATSRRVVAAADEFGPAPEGQQRLVEAIRQFL